MFYSFTNNIAELFVNRRIYFNVNRFFVFRLLNIYVHNRSILKYLKRLYQRQSMKKTLKYQSILTIVSTNWIIKFFIHQFRCSWRNLNRFDREMRTWNCENAWTFRIEQVSYICYQCDLRSENVVDEWYFFFFKYEILRFNFTFHWNRDVCAFSHIRFFEILK